MQEVCDGGPGKTLSGYTHGNLGKDYMELTAAAVATVGYGAEEMWNGAWHVPNTHTKNALGV